MLGCPPSPKVAPKPAKRVEKPGLAEGERFAVATENAEASRVALEVLRAGGDAVDAAVAAAFTLGVATPTACGIGGGGFAVVYRAKTREVFVLDFRETAPEAVDAATLDERPKMPPEKRASQTGVPGEVAGLAELLRRYGKTSFAKALAPAIELAKKGAPITTHVAKVTAYTEEKAHLRTISPELGALYFGPNGVLPVGTRVPRLALAKTLETLAAQGPRALYEGPIAAAIVEAARAAGGTLSMADLAGYRTLERKPLRRSFTLPSGTREVVTMPPPSAGGVMLLEALEADAAERSRLKNGKGLDQDALGSAAYVHHVAEVMRGAFSDRAHYIGDPAYAKADVAALIDATRLSRRWSTFDPWKTHSIADLHLEEHGTSHLAIVDAEGNAVALTTTVNTSFGAKLVAGDTGIVLNDELDDFSRPSDVPLARELQPNLPRAGMRPTSSMTPTIVLEDGAVRLVVGGSGGKLITTSVTAVSLATLIFGASPEDAIAAPRFNPTDKGLLIEGSMPEAVRKDLEARGEKLIEWKDWLNAVQAITVDAAGHRKAAADLRKAGVPLAE